MTWTIVGSVPISLNWQFTDIVEGELFRLTLSGIAVGDSYYIAQAQVNDDGSKDLFDLRLVTVSGTRQLFSLIKPDYVGKRQVALKQVPRPVPIELELRRVINSLFLQPPRTSYAPVQRANWTAQIEVNDTTANKTTTNDITNALKPSFDAIAQQIKNIPTSPAPDLSSLPTTTSIVAALKSSFDTISQQIQAIPLSSTPASASSSSTNSPSSRAKTFTYASDGDTNGVCYWLGTNYGNTTWTNPQIAKIISITASSVYNLDHNHPEELVDRQTSNNYATADQLNNWFQLDLGDTSKLKCNYYSLRGRDYFANHPRSWKLQGTNDIDNWYDIDIQVNNTAINQNSWLSLPVSSSIAYRAFRILMTGSDNGGQNILALGEWEFYGTLTY